MPWHPMKEHMDKLDAWGAAQKKKIDDQRTAGQGSGISVKDRLNLARGKDDRWAATGGSGRAGSEDAPALTGDQTNITPMASASRSRIGAPPPPPTARKPAGLGANGIPPPPPARNVGTTPAAPPSLPPRMNNEDGIDTPPPTYGAAVTPPAPAPRASSSVSVPRAATTAGSARGYIEFSKFTQEDKEAFFSLLDEFFESRVSLSNQPPASHAGRVQGAAPAVVTRTIAPPKPTGPKPKSTLAIATAAQIPASSPSTSEHPMLSASAYAAEAEPSAWGASRYFFDRSDASWTSFTPWFASQPVGNPAIVSNRKDLYSMARVMSLGSKHTYNGAMGFADLSMLWYQIEWDANRPHNPNVQIALRAPPGPLGEAELKEGTDRYGELIASFCEAAEQENRHVGDGECWTLAKEAIDYANNMGGYPGGEQAVSTIGRTHGHLIFAGLGAPTVARQVGRWRGGDRIRERWGGIRRGDIVEWKTAVCTCVDMPKGSYMNIGDPEHTAVVVADSPVPEHLGGSDESEQPSIAPHELQTLEVIEQSAHELPTRRKYDLSLLTKGEIRVYRPVAVNTYLGGVLTADWPPSLPDAQICQC